MALTVLLSYALAVSAMLFYEWLGFSAALGISGILVIAIGVPIGYVIGTNLRTKSKLRDGAASSGAQPPQS